jgi:hypothetical protein
MYKIIGADGNEYGPVNDEQIRQWIAEGRANEQTRVRVEDAPELADSGGPAGVCRRTGRQAAAAVFVFNPRYSSPDSGSGPSVGPATGLTSRRFLDFRQRLMVIWFLVAGSVPSITAGLGSEIEKIFQVAATWGRW